MGSVKRKWTYHDYGPSRSRMDVEAYESYQKRCRELWDCEPAPEAQYKSTVSKILVPLIQGSSNRVVSE
jgi:hypothetical protein